MNKLLRNAQGHLRNGWWILLFAVVFVASQPVYRLVSKALKGLGAGKDGLLPLPVVFLLLITWLCMRVRRQPLSGIGLRLDASWWRQASAGLAFGIAQMLGVVAMILAAGGVRFDVDATHGLAGLAYGLWFFTWVAVLEELLFRGFVFQRLVDGLGAPAGLLVMGALFALAHWGNPGMEGATKLWATIDTVLAALMLGLAWLRTGSLALPIGLHLGWNWAQGALLGFDVSGMAQAGWLVPHLLDKPQWLSGGAFGPEASVFAVVIDAIAVGVVWRWKGTVRGSRAMGATFTEAAWAPGLDHQR